jgi:hypothetical protein
MKAKCKFPVERTLLLALADADQKIRNEGDFTKPETFLEMNRIDYFNQNELVKILDKIKIPSVSNIGIEGARAAWLIAQHSSNNIDMLINMYKLIIRCTKNDHSEGYYRGIPYLVDRINIFKGKPQVYGTQIYKMSSIKVIPYPIINPKLLDKRRGQYGLDPFKVYTTELLSNFKIKKV